MKAEQTLTETRPSTLLPERSRSRENTLEHTLVALGQLALAQQLSITPEALLLMAQDLRDVPWRYLEIAITGWRRGTLRMGKPEQMDRFPTVRQLRLQADLLQFEGWVNDESL